MKKFRNVPALMSLAAGFVTCVLMIMNRITIVPYLWTLLLVMAGFYAAGLILRLVLNKVFEDKTEETEENSEEGQETEEGAEASEENKEDADGAQSQSKDEKKQ